MDVLCFSPAQSPLLCTKFTGNGTVKSFPSAVVRRSSRRRLKPLIYAAVSKPLNAPSSVAADDDVPIYSPSYLQVPSGQLVPNKDKGKNVTIDLDEYLRDILLSDVYDVAVVSPFQQATLLSEKQESSGNKFWVKRDDLQSVYSFKLRGAYNMMSNLPKEQLAKGVITASAGNHAQGVALSASRLNCHAVIVMPTSAPQIKKDAVKRLGGANVTVDPHGETFDDSQAYALQQAEEKGYKFIPPFDHVDIIKGQGTIGPEIVRQMPRDVEAIFVPIGGGGLVSGIVAYFAALLPSVKIIGVEPAGSNGMAISFDVGQRVQLDSVDPFADGVAVKLVGKETYNVCKQLLDGVVLVTDAEISGAIKDVYEENRNILEPSGAVALAGAKAYCKFNKIKEKNVVSVASGANMDFAKLKDVVDKAGLGNDEEALMATYLPEQPGSFRQFCELVGSLNISEVKYRYDPNKEKALLQYSVAYSAKEELDAMVKRLESSQLQTINLSQDVFVQEHFRYLVGGRSDVENELICRFVIPDKPGALLKVLNAFNPRWNISLAHYRIQGSVYAKVLLGIQVSDSEMNAFHDAAKSLGYDYQVRPKNQHSFRHLI